MPSKARVNEASMIFKLGYRQGTAANKVFFFRISIKKITVIEIPFCASSDTGWGVIGELGSRQLSLSYLS